MPETDAQRTARRARAMWAYSLMDQKDLADKSGIHRDRFRAIIARANPKQASAQELQAIASAAGIPLSFAARGFELDDDRDIDELWAEVGRLREELARKEDRLTDARVGELLGPALLAAVQGSVASEARAQRGGRARDRQQGPGAADDE